MNLFSDKDLDQASEKEVKKDNLEIINIKNQVVIAPIFFDEKQRRKVFDYSEDLVREIHDFKNVAIGWYSNPTASIEAHFRFPLDSFGDLVIQTSLRGVDNGEVEVGYEKNEEIGDEETDRGDGLVTRRLSPERLPTFIKKEFT
mgnify:CR=1 FL=1|jgi:hypothetical protein